jgi:hypothetical protein
MKFPSEKSGSSLKKRTPRVSEPRASRPYIIIVGWQCGIYDT